MFTMNSSSELSAILFLLYKNAALIAASTVSCGNYPALRAHEHDY